MWRICYTTNVSGAKLPSPFSSRRFPFWQCDVLTFALNIKYIQAYRLLLRNMWKSCVNINYICEPIYSFTLGVVWGCLFVVLYVYQLGCGRVEIRLFVFINKLYLFVLYILNVLAMTFVQLQYLVHEKQFHVIFRYNSSHFPLEHFGINAKPTSFSNSHIIHG